MFLLRVAFCALIVLAAAALPARAGDTAEIEVLGFTDDGAIFAFEEFGVQDGSGFPYANRFYIDTATDRFVAGTPVRVRIDDETVPLAEARAQAAAQAQSIVTDAQLSRGLTAGWNPITELSADPHRISVNPRPVIPPIDDPLEFRLTELPVAEPERCRDLGPVLGFRLVRVGVEPGEQAVLVHEDAGSVPASRGCPLGYHIGGLQTFFPEAGPPVFALMIAVRSFGFEGPDHRWIAIAGRL